MTILISIKIIDQLINNKNKNVKTNFLNRSIVLFFFIFRFNFFNNFDFFKIFNIVNFQKIFNNNNKKLFQTQLFCSLKNNRFCYKQKTNSIRIKNKKLLNHQTTKNFKNLIKQKFMSSIKTKKTNFLNFFFKNNKKTTTIITFSKI